MEKTLSIIVPSYNAENYLNQSIPSMLNIININQLEILIVNDGSTDDTRKVAEKFQRKHENTVKIINKINGGHGSAINIGIKNSCGKYIKVIDADDWVISESLDSLISFLESKTVDCVVTPFYTKNQDTGEQKEENYFINTSIEESKIYSYEYFLNQICVIPRMHSVTFRKEIFVNNNIKIDENMFYVDMQYITYPMPYINDVCYFGKPCYVYRIGNANQSVSINNYIKNRNMVKHVCRSLVSFFENNSLVFTEIEKRLLLKLILSTIGIYFKIMLSMKEYSISKNEIIRFSDEFEKYINLSEEKKVRYPRILNYKFFILFSYVYRFFNRK